MVTSIAWDNNLIIDGNHVASTGHFNYNFQLILIDNFISYLTMLADEGKVLFAIMNTLYDFQTIYKLNNLQMKKQ